MTIIDDAARARISGAIEAAERATSGELVTVIADESDEYRHIPIVWAALIALFLPAALHLIGLDLGFLVYYQFQIIAFVGFGMLFQWRPLKMRLVPAANKRRRAGRLAREQFFAQGLHRTRERTGVLLFVSVAERYVEIIADSGIDEKVAADAWSEIVAAFADQVKDGQAANGFVQAVEACGALLANCFPRPDDDRDELPNHLIEI